MLQGASLGKLALAVALALPGVAARAEEALEGDLLGRTVVSVSYVADGEIDRNEIGRMVAIRSGRPLTADDSAATVRNLFATRRFSDVRIEAIPEGDGLAVTLVLFRAFRVHPLRFSGRAGVLAAELAKALPFAAGTTYSSELVGQGAEALERRLQADGYLAARVRPAVVFDRVRFDAHVTYVIDAGAAARAAEPFLDGDTAPFPAAELLSRMRLKPGDRYRETLARADAVRMTDYVHKKEHFRGLVELIAAQPAPDGRIIPVYRVRIGPRVVFEGKGIKPAKLAKEIQAMAEAQSIDEELVLQYVEGRKDALQRSGRYRAQVTYAFDARSDPALTHIRVDVEEGPKFFVEAVRFEGNASIPDKTLYGLMATHTKGLPLVSPGRLVDSVLADDVEAILATYQSRGWIRARVPPPSIADGKKPGGLVVSIKVEEGPRAYVTSRVLEGAEQLDPPTAEKLMTVKEKAPLDPNAVRADTGALASWYHDRGFREAVVRDTIALSDDGTSASVTYRVDEGLKSFFGKAIIRGNTRTATSRIQRLATWTEGDALSESQLLDTQSRLSRAGVFRRVDVRPQRADPVTQTRNVDVEVEEGRPWSLLYGVGYQYSPDTTNNQNDPYVAGGVSYNNLLGLMIRAGVEAQYSPLSQRGRIQASLRDPYFLGTQYPLNVLGYLSRELVSDVELERRGVAFDSSRIVAPGLRIGLRYTYQRIRPTNPEVLSLVDLSGLPAVSRPIHESTIGPDILYDRRDDIIDPHSGYYLAASGKYAFPFLSADARFTKFSAQATGFLRLFGRGALVGSARLGGVFPYGSAPNSVPIGEQFLAGGRSTQRAFDTDLLGIPGETVDYSTVATPHTGSGQGTCATAHPDLATYDCNFGPRIIGGNGFIALNVELRIPIAGNLGGVVFWDAAQSWKAFSEIQFRFEGDRGLRQGVGFGLRYMTPIGPVRVEYGLPVSARTIGFDIVEQLKDPNGNPIPCKGVPAPPCVRILGHDTTKESGRFFFSVGYPF